MTMTRGWTLIRPAVHSDYLMSCSTTRCEEVATFQPMPEQSQVAGHYWTSSCTKVAVAVVASWVVAVDGQRVVGTVAVVVERLAFGDLHQRQGWRPSSAFAIEGSEVALRMASFDLDHFLAAVDASDFLIVP